MTSLESTSAERNGGADQTDLTDLYSEILIACEHCAALLQSNYELEANDSDVRPLPAAARLAIVMQHLEEGRKAVMDAIKS